LRSWNVARSRRKITPTEKFRIDGKEIPQERLRKIWEEIREELVAEGYAVENVKLPEVRAFRLKYKKFSRVFRQLEKSSHIRDTYEEEYGEKSNKILPSACVFFSDVDQKWFVLKCDGRGHIETDLKHELYHLWEDTLKLKWGTLTEKV
jgi:hypothetical protein